MRFRLINVPFEQNDVSGEGISEWRSFKAIYMNKVFLASYYYFYDADATFSCVAHAKIKAIKDKMLAKFLPSTAIPSEKHRFSSDHRS